MTLLRSITTVGGLTLVSRVLGFVRDLLIAAVAGAGPVADAFFVAFKLPNLFRRLFAEGALNAAFLPLFAGALEREGPAAAKAFAGQAIVVMLIVLVPFTFLMQLAMPWIVPGLAPGFTERPEALEMAVYFGRITFPYLMMMTLVALLSAILNTYYKFWAAAAAPILLNVVLVACLLVLTPVLPNAGHALAWGVAGAGIAQFLWLAVACRRIDMLPSLPRPRLTPRMRKFGRLILPGAIGAGVTQLNLVVGTIFASLIPGAVSWLYYADRLNQLPLGVVGIAVGVALLPMLARQLRAGEADRAMETQNRAIEFALVLTLPATAALIAIPHLLVAALFERGAFTPADSQATASALAAYAAGLPAYVLVKTLQPGFFAREDTRTPVLIAGASILVNIALTPLLMWPLGHVGIALSTAIAAWTNVVGLWLVLHRRAALRIEPVLARRLPRLAGCTLAMAGLLLGLAWLLEGYIDGSSAARLTAAVVLVTGGMALYLTLIQLTGATDLGSLLRRVRRRRA
ncbi:MAG: murein biosynthesis integral membrane protein MurJ [Alphaproteobacteria bacterium]